MFRVGSRFRQEMHEEGQITLRPKHCIFSNEDDVNIQNAA